MKAEDLGIDLRTGYHDKRLTRAESKFVGILWSDHVGERHKISAESFAIKYGYAHSHEHLTPMSERRINFWKREIRYMHNHLLKEHSDIPILSKAGVEGGYWIAENDAEAKEFYSTFRKRGLTGLVKATRGRKAATVDIVQQLAFEFEDLVDQTGFTHMIRPRAGTPMPIEIVDAFLEKMTRDPDKFADGLRKIGEKYGGVLLPKQKVAAIQAEIAKLQQMASGLGIDGNR